MRLLASLSCVLLLGCSHRATLPDGSPAWVELETDHFILLTDVSESEARNVARELEEARSAMIAGSWHGKLLPRDKIKVVELADYSEMREFTPKGVGGFFASSATFGEQLMVMSAQQSPSQQPLLKHELAHQLNSLFLLRSRPWVHEGLACYLQTMRYDHAQERYIIGEPDENRLLYLKLHPETDLGRVLSLAPEEVGKLSMDEGYAFETASWLVVFYLVNQRWPQFNDYIHRLAQGQDPEAAFDAAFPSLPVQQLWSSIAAYKENRLFQKIGLGERRSDYRELRIEAPRFKGNVAVRALGKADIAATRAELFLYGFSDEDRATRSARARAAADEALAVDPGHPLALATRLAIDREVTSAAIEKVRAAVRAHPQDPHAWQLLGEVLPDSDFLERKAALEQAAALAPESPAILDALAWDHVRGGRAQEGLPIALKAAAVSPGRSGVLDTVGAALAMSGRCGEALRVQERAVELMSERASARYKAAVTSRLQAFREGCRDVPLK
jgi:Flp pilus assembly protein TadD